MDEILTGAASEAQIASFVTALHMKGETSSELIGFARVMREKAEPFWDTEVLPVLDTCGTGGDAAGTFNISTATAFVVAGAGIRVAKHGNRSSTPKLNAQGMGARCGAADVMEALGVNIKLPPALLGECLEKVGIAFLFAPAVHSAARYVQNARRETRL